MQVNLASFSADVTLPGTAAVKPVQAPTPVPVPTPSTPTPPAPATPSVTAPATPPASSPLGPGQHELYPGSGAGDLKFGMNGVEVSKVLGPPSTRQIWKPIAGLLYRPVQLTYQQFGMSILMANGQLWGVGATIRDWVLKPYGVRVGDSRQAAIRSIGYNYETQTEGDQTAIAYKREGILLFVRNDVVQMIVVFLPLR